MINQGTHQLECKCFSWKPVIAGALLIIGLSFLLNLFNVAIGLTAYTTDSQGVENMALGGMIATALGLVVAMFASGWVAGYLGTRHCHKRHLGALYGFLAWCVALIATLFLVESMQHYVNFYTHFISGTSVETVAATTNAGGQVTATVDSAKSLVISSYIVFSLFFLSAFACCLGGHCGMRYVDKE